MKLTIAVPIYHASAASLNRLFDSIEKSVCCSHEILLIFDGSKDNEEAMGLRFANEQAIRRIVKKHEGVSAARNKAIDEARGDWIMFCDADDYLTPNAIHDLLACGEKNHADIVFSNHYREYGKRKEKIAFFKKEETYSESSIPCIKDVLSVGSDQGTVWGKIFRAEFLKDNSLYFDTNLENGEDQELMVRAATYNPKVVVCPFFTYVYVINRKSSIRNYDEDYVVKINKTIDTIKKDILLTGYGNELKNCINSYILDRLILIMLNYVFNTQKTLFEQKKAFYIVRHSQVYDRVLSENINTSFNGMRMLLLFLIKKGLFHCSRLIICGRNILHHV